MVGLAPRVYPRLRSAVRYMLDCGRVMVRVNPNCVCACAKIHGAVYFGWEGDVSRDTWGGVFWLGG